MTSNEGKAGELTVERVRELRDLHDHGKCESQRCKDIVKLCDAWLATSAANDGWMPIETAPHDWLLLVRDFKYMLAFHNGTYWHDQQGRSLDFAPKEWRYIPGAPNHLGPQPNIPSMGSCKTCGGSKYSLRSVDGFDTTVPCPDCAVMS